MRSLKATTNDASFPNNEPHDLIGHCNVFEVNERHTFQMDLCDIILLMVF